MALVGKPMEISWNGGTPSFLGVSMLFHYKLSILGVPHVWKPPGLAWRPGERIRRIRRASALSQGEDFLLAMSVKHIFHVFFEGLEPAWDGPWFLERPDLPPRRIEGLPFKTMCKWGDERFFWTSRNYQHLLCHVTMVDDTVDGCEILHHQFGMVESPWGPSTFKGLLVQTPHLSQWNPSAGHCSFDTWKSRCSWDDLMGTKIGVQWIWLDITAGWWFGTCVFPLY